LIFFRRKGLWGLISIGPDKEKWELLILWRSQAGTPGNESNPFFCHPERSEGSQGLEKARFFSPLRMTFWVNLRF
jgi:hypothetical protein